MAASVSRAFEALESKFVKRVRPLLNEFPKLAALAFTPCAQLQAGYLKMEDLLEHPNLPPLTRLFLAKQLMLILAEMKLQGCPAPADQ